MSERQLQWMEGRFRWMPRMQGAGHRLSRLGTVRWSFPGFGCLDGPVFVSCFRFAGALEGSRRYAGVRTVNACVRPLPAECLEA